MVNNVNYCFCLELQTVIITFADAEGAGARSRLDAVLKGLVERSENEKSVKLSLLRYETHLIIVITFQSD